MKAAKKWHVPSASAMLRSFVALVLCTGLMIPTNLTAYHTAYADTATGSTTDELRHGTVSISSEQASGDVINLKVGQTATVSVSPYAHMQYKGCGKSDCPEKCESDHGMECFVSGMGCKCDRAATERTANVTATVADTSIATAGDVVAGAWNNEGNLDLHDASLPVTKDATITLTAAKAGTTTVTVAAATDENGNVNNASNNTSTLLEFWHPATKTYTVNVTDDAAEDDQPSFADLESEHDYASNTDQTWTYTWEAAGQYGMALTFDEQTATESGWDFIYILDGDDNELGKYSGSELAGKTVYVPQSKTAKIHLTSDGSGNKWGFKVTNITKLESNDLSLIASIDPISPQFLSTGAKPAPVVHYGAKTLVAGTDYTVSYEGNEAVGDAKVVVTGIGIYTGKVERAFKVVDENNLADGAAITADQTIVLRQSGEKGSANVSLKGANAEWANAVTGVTVKAISGNDAGAEQQLSADQWSVIASTGRISFSRTEATPVFSVAPGEGSPVDVTNRWGETTTYPQSKQYQITVKAAGYNDAVGTVTFATGASTEFSIIVDADGDDKTTDDRTVVKTFTKDDIESMATFQNGSSQCGMTGFRTFSAKGVALSDLIAAAGVTVSETDAFKLDTTDNFGRTWTYSQLFGDRYFLQSIYDDQEVKDTYAELVKSDDEAGATVQLRKLLAAKAVEDNSIAKPMMSANYVETLISGDEVATAELPTAENTKVNQLVGQENQYRFTYGISLVKEDHTVTFDSNGGSDVAAQTVQSNLMTSTENTTIRSTYWNNALVIYRNAADAPEADANPEQLSVPENPTREGYTFAGWYTKDGSGDGDWGEQFDFSANNGTVDVDTQLYAKWDVDPTVPPSFAGLESEHNYADNADQTWEYTWEAAGQYGMALTFDEQTMLENGYDYLYLLDGEGNELGKYTGSELAGKTVYVPQSKTVKLRLVSDYSGNKWGFKVTNVAKLESNDLGLIASIDPISPQFLSEGAKPAPVVHYGAKTLVAGTDYTVSYEGNEAVGDAKVVVTGIGIYTGKVERAFKVVDENNLADGATIKDNQQVLLRQAGEKGSANVSLEGADAEWANVVTSVTVKALNGNDAGAEQQLSADQWSVNASNGRISFVRTDAAPVFSVAAGENGPVDVKGRRGTTTYPQHKQYQITVKANGYNDVVGTVTFYTGSAAAFSIVVDEDGDTSTTDDQTVKASWTADQLKALSGYGFQNGSSQCGMTGFRTFSGYGVPVKDLMEIAGVEPSDKDSYLIDTADHYGNNQTYQSLFGSTRYFMQSIYDDQEVKDTYAKLVQSDDEAGSTVALRKLLASKALEDNSVVEPMISTGYVESLIGQDEVAGAQLPTAENTKISNLVSLENQFRFVYGITLEKEDHTVTFDSNGGSDVAAQTVQSNLMTSQSNTTWSSSYWATTLYVFPNKGKEVVADTNPEQLSVPENPTREGYTFAGWYTKDGSGDGDWGEQFDFSANNGTVDVDTQLYAKWLANDAVATQTSHSTQAYRDAEYGVQPNGDSSNAGQHVRTVISFDEPVAITDADALAKSLSISITGAQSNSITADGNNLVIDSTLGFALMGGTAKVSATAVTGLLDGVTVGGKLVKLDPVNTLVDTGLAFEPVSVTVGTDTTPASTTFRVTHSANVRSMNHVIWMTTAADGAKAAGAHSILPNTGGASQSTTAHHHVWYKFTPSASAVSIVDNAAESLSKAGYTVSTTAAIDDEWNTTVDNGGLFTITANTARAGEVLSADVYTDSFLTANGLELGEDVSNVQAPAATASVDLGMKVDVGDDGYETVSTNMGKNPAGKVDFSLVASDGALAEYQKSHADATMKDMLQVWAQNVTKVTVGGTVLEGKAFDEWKAELNDAASDAGKLPYYQLTAGTKKATLTLPIALFDQSSEKSTKTVSIESTGFADFTGDVTYRNIGANAVVVRILSEDGSTVDQTKTLTLDDLKKLTVQQHYNTAANCGMAGLRAFSSEGVLLTDVLNAAGVDFGKGMTLKLRVNDYLAENGTADTTEAGYANAGYTYEDLLGTDRYYYPAMWDNTTTYDELNGQTIYQVLSADKDAWKGDSEQAKFLAKKLGETKQAASPILAWNWNEGVVAWGGSNPADAEGYNGYTSQESFRFLYGLSVNEDGSAADESTTFSNVYAVFGIDVIGGQSTDDPDAGIYSVKRVAGEDGTAAGTAAAVSTSAFDSADTVVLATDSGFADAMSATGLAGAYNAPILLTGKDSLDANAAAEIARLHASKIVVIGGTSVVSDKVIADAAQAAGISADSVERIFGNEAEDTSVACAQALAKLEGPTDAAIVASSVSFQDALSISSFAYKYHVPVFLQTAGATSADRALTAEAIEMLTGEGYYANATVYVPGGIGAVSADSVEGTLGTRGYVRMYGEDGYDTSNAIANYMVRAGLLSADNAVIACGAQNAGGTDALAGAALAGIKGSVVLLANGNEEMEAANTVTIDNFVAEHAADINRAYALGGTYVMPSDLMKSIDSLIG